jgi:hypothetical protein
LLRDGGEWGEALEASRGDWGMKEHVERSFGFLDLSLPLHPVAHARETASSSHQVERLLTRMLHGKEKESGHAPQHKLQPRVAVVN